MGLFDAPGKDPDDSATQVASAIDQITHRFGKDAVQRGKLIKRRLPAGE